MAHALKRVSYASCTADKRQFAFVAREPRQTNNNAGKQNYQAVVARPGVQYCHVYRTDTAEQADEINVVVGNAFRQAYLNQLKTNANGNSDRMTESTLVKSSAVPPPPSDNDHTGRHSVETHSPSSSSQVGHILTMVKFMACSGQI